MTAKKEENVTVSLRIPKYIHDHLKDVAKAGGLSVSEQVRDSLSMAIYRDRADAFLERTKQGYPFKADIESRTRWTQENVEFITSTRKYTDQLQEVYEDQVKLNEKIIDALDEMRKTANKVYGTCDAMVVMFKDGKVPEDEADKHIKELTGLSLKEYMERMESERGLREFI